MKLINGFKKERSTELKIEGGYGILRLVFPLFMI